MQMGYKVKAKPRQREHRLQWEYWKKTLVQPNCEEGKVLGNSAFILMFKHCWLGNRYHNIFFRQIKWNGFIFHCRWCCSSSGDPRTCPHSPTTPTRDTTAPVRSTTTSLPATTATTAAATTGRAQHRRC